MNRLLKYAPLLLLMGLISCSEDIADLDLNNILDERNETPPLYHFEDFIYNDLGLEYELLVNVVVHWELLEGIEGIESFRIYVDGLGFTNFPRESEPATLRRFVDKGAPYCTSISFRGTQGESRQIEGECFTVPL